MDAKKELEYLSLIIRHINGMQTAMKEYLDMRKRELEAQQQKAANG